MKTYLFDFDGTLVDSMPTYSQVMLRILRENNIPHSSDIIKTITPLGLLKTAEHFISLGLDKTVEEIVLIMRDYLLEEYLYSIPAKEKVPEVLRLLKDRGDSLHVLTASPHATLDPCLKRLGIYALFENVWSCDDFATTKSDPAIYHMAAERIGVRVDQVLFLDDNLNADRTARAAGMRVCGVFDESSAEYEEEIRAAADFYIRDFSQLPELEF